MRDYAKVAPQFWTGKTGKALKAAGPEAVIVGMYLMTSPHANMIGVYHCPLGYIAIDTGLTIEGASKGLQSAIEADFCTFDEDSGYVFVHEFAAYQIGDELKADDKRCAGVNNELSKVPKNQCWRGFRARYAVAFHLPIPVENASPSEAPSKPLRSQEQEQEKEQKQEKGEERVPRKRVTTLSRPDDVAEQVWDDWVDLRTRKKTTVSKTAVDEARKEAVKAGITLERFLAVWCIRGSQGLQASWLTSEEKTETTYQRSMREKYEQVAPSIAAKKPGTVIALNPMDVLDDLTRIAG